MLKKIWHFCFPKKTDLEKVQFDIDQRKVSFGTIFLGIILGGFLLIQTETGLWDIKSFLDEPKCPLNHCSELSIEQTDEWFYDLNNYQYEAIDHEQYPELKSLFEAAKQDFIPLNKVRNDIQELENQKSFLSNDVIDKQRAYDTGLLEDIADRNAPIFNNPNTQNQVQDVTQELAQLENKLATKKRNENDLFKVYEKSFAPLKQMHDQSLETYHAKKRIYDLKVFALQFLITFPLFLVGNVWYRRSREKDSKYSILPLILMVVGGITFLQILVMYASSWIAFEFFVTIFKWLAELPFGRLIVHYVFIFLGIAVFGVLIINLQRRLFSEKRIALKRLNKKECPHCALPLTFSDSFCAGCGETLKISCTHCKQKTYKLLANCQHCGQNPKE